MTTEEEVIGKLKGVIDPHTGESVYDMGMIPKLKVNGDAVDLTFTPTTPFCPIGIQLATAIKRALQGVEGLKEINVTVVGHTQEKELNEKLAKM
ncbi:MAG: metal-sulfur cluster assembly factor [Candidatus Hydrothermarchaeales archaeon]